jgi:hypothetical protein
MNRRLAIIANFSSLCSVILLVGFLFVSISLSAQDRPLQTPDTEIVAPGTVRASTGFDFLQDQKIPFSGLQGDLTSVGVMDLRLGVGKIVEVQLQGAAKNFLSIKEQGASFTTLNLPSSNSTSDTGDFSLWTKVRIMGEGKRRPAVAFRFGFELPNSNQARGIGTNTTNVFAMVILEKHIGKLKLFGDVGIAILQSPLQLFSQNDETLYGVAFSYPIFPRVDVVGEVSGRQSARKISNDLVGTESGGQARLGVQILAGGFHWDVAGIAGLYHSDARSGFTFGVSRDISLFKIPAGSGK